MNILITAGASALAQDLARALSKEHSVRLTDVVDVQTQLPFVRCDLGHDEATDRLVAGVDVLIHLAASHSEYAERTSDNSEISANRLIDYQTRCTYNLLHAASEAGVPRCIYASSLVSFRVAMTIGPSTGSGGPGPPLSRRFWRSTWESSCAGSSRGKGVSPSPACAWVTSAGQMTKRSSHQTRCGSRMMMPCTLLNARWRRPRNPGLSTTSSRRFPGHGLAAPGRRCDRLCSMSGQLGE